MDILEHLSARPGQTQEGRLPVELAPHFVRVEERDARALYEYLRGHAAQVPFFVPGSGALARDGDWAAFFAEALPQTREGKTRPHLALLAAFLKLYRVPRTALNGFTARHLEFSYERVLGFAKRPPVPDRAHLLIELKKGAAPLEIHPLHAFSAGKDASGVELVYGPTARTVINHAKVASLCSVRVEPAGGGTVRFAPKADSADGLGGKLPKEEPKWPPFGVPRAAEIPPAPIGFAVASAVLRMKEGVRRVTLDLELESVPAGLTKAVLEARLEAFVTGQTRWLGPYELEATPQGGRALSLVFTVGAGDEAVADYDAAKHGHAFFASAPVLQVLLKAEAPHGYEALRPLVVRAAKLAVHVEGIKSLQLESDAGTLDARRAFQPFGPQPLPGSRFMVGCAEALSKKLSALTLELRWLGLPASFTAQYDDYTVKPTQDSVKVKVALRDAGGWETNPDELHGLFDSRLSFAPSGTGGASATPGAQRSMHTYALAAGGSAWLRRAAALERLRMPVLGFAAAAAPQLRQGFITLKLASDLGHAEYRSKLLLGRPRASEPYTPALSEISLSYDAATERADLEATGEAAFAGAELGYFHVGCFGQRREHAYLRSQFPFVDDRRVPLLPAYEDEGELLIGLSGLGAGDSVSLLFKVAEGSADPEAEQQTVRWAVLCDNYWKPLAGGDAVRDGTNSLLASGLVAVTIPVEATTFNSFLPPGLLWLKAAVRRQVGAVCSLLSVAANAVEVRRRPGGAAAGREWTPLPAGTIAKLKTPLAAVKAAAQPFASFRGTTLESQEALNTRAAERLRHRARCISAWDYERTVLAGFPEIRKAKCIPHCAGHGAWLSPGNVLLVVVPDLRNRKNAVDPLQPRADADTLSRIQAELQERAPMQITIRVRNPRYERIRLDFKLKFYPGFEFNYYSRELRRLLIEHLSPWMRDPGAGISFGGAVYKSALLDFVEEVEYVDYVTDFRMVHLRGGADDSTDVNEARASTPDAILVSDATHDLASVP